MTTNENKIIHTFIMTERHATLIHQQIRGHCEALKNWMASAVERGDHETAQRLVVELREHQAIFATFNMEAKHTIAANTDMPMETTHYVRKR